MVNLVIAKKKVILIDVTAHTADICFGLALIPFIY